MARTKKVVKDEARDAPSRDATPPAAAARDVKPIKSKLDKKRKRSSRRQENFRVYIHKTLKDTMPDMNVSMKAMQVLDSLVNDIFERIASESNQLIRAKKSTTMASRDVQTAVRLVFPAELAKHAVSEGTKALSKYTASTQQQ